MVLAGAVLFRSQPARVLFSPRSGARSQPPGSPAEIGTHAKAGVQVFCHRKTPIATEKAEEEIWLVIMGHSSVDPLRPDSRNPFLFQQAGRDAAWHQRVFDSRAPAHPGRITSFEFSNSQL